MTRRDAIMLQSDTQTPRQRHQPSASARDREEEDVEGFAYFTCLFFLFCCFLLFFTIFYLFNFLFFSALSLPFLLLGFFK